MPMCLVMASESPTCTDREAVPALHVLEPMAPSMGMRAAARAERVRFMMKERFSGFPSGQKRGSSSETGKGEPSLRAVKQATGHRGHPGRAG